MARVWQASAQSTKVTFREGRLASMISFLACRAFQDGQLALDLAKQYPSCSSTSFKTPTISSTPFQDHRIAADSRTYVIGDPKQAIYRFRGADINTYLRATHRTRNNTDSIPIGGQVSIVKRSITCSAQTSRFLRMSRSAFFLHCPVRRLRATLFCRESARSHRADLLLIQVRQATSEHPASA